MRILVVNAGSSSLKLRVIDDGDRLAASRDLPAPRGRAGDAAIEAAIRELGAIDAVGHRIVHGGVEFSQPVVIDPAVVGRLRALTDLAPLHQPKSLEALALVSAVLPAIPAVACFDTAFHAGMPAAASTYALPAEWRKRWNLRRYGFHGLSHAYASRRAAELLSLAPNAPQLGPEGRRPGEAQAPDDLRIVTCHLGAGASLAAVRGGRSVDTTMGFTPLEGLVMATRSGSVDPGLVLWLEEHVGTPAAELASTLEHRSGLVGLAGTDDMRVIIERASAGEPDAGLALDVYLHRLRAGIAAMAASMGGLDVLVFTGGVGEHAPVVRERAGLDLGFLGVAVDRDRNLGGGSDRDISAPNAHVRTFVIEAREDLEIARQVRQALRGD